VPLTAVIYQVASTLSSVRDKQSEGEVRTERTATRSTSQVQEVDHI
jgi:hypothetical protein